MDDKTQNKTPENPVLAFFASVRLSIFLLLTLAATSIVGTLIPQEGSPGELTRSFGPALYRLFEFLDLFDMYRSWWFQCIVGLLGVNLIVCTLRRFPQTWKIVAQAKPGFKKSRFDGIRDRHSFESGHSPEKMAERAHAFLGRRFRTTSMSHEKEVWTLYGEKGRWTRLGFYVIHAAFLCILAGALAGSIWGYSGHVFIPEGETAQEVKPQKGGEPIPLPFTLRCDKFTLDYYEGTRMISEFTSFVTVMEPGKEPWTTEIRVNHPLRLHGVSFYQSTYDVSQHSGTVDMVFTNPETGARHEVSAPLRQMAPLPGGKGRFLIAGYRENFHTQNHDLGPAVQLHLFPAEGQPISMMMPVGMPDFVLNRAGLDISVADSRLAPLYVTGLKVTKDPGVWVVYTGFILILIGCLITFFLSHRQLYIRISPRKKGSLVEVAGWANKNRQGFEESVRRMAGKLESKE